MSLTLLHLSCKSNDSKTISLYNVVQGVIRMDILTARKVRKVYGNRFNQQEVLRSIDLEVEKGEFVGIMGASGSGKTTLLNVLCSIDKVTDGIVDINGKSLHLLKDRDLAAFRRDELGFIFQDYNLLDTLTVKENILLPLSIKKMDRAETEKRFNKIVSILGIEDTLDKYPNQISGGQKQRTSAARALITNPTIIFADEPTGALDSKSATALLEKLEQINKEEAVTIMMVTHDAVAASYCSRVLFLKDGQIFTELYRGDQTRKQFFAQILHTQSILGGDGFEA